MQDPSVVALQLIILVFMLFGLFGLLTTIIPGLVIIWVSALIYWMAVGFNTISIILMVIMTLLMLVGSVVDNILMGGAARKTGASWLAIGVALVAGVVGSLVFPPFGGLVAALLGLFVVEYLRLKDVKLALQSTRGMAAGCGWSVLLRFGIGLIMVFMWGGWVLLAQ